MAQINYAHLEHSHSGFVDVRKSAVAGAACRGPDLWTTVLIVRLGHYAAGLLSANRFEPEMALLFPPGCAALLASVNWTTRARCRPRERDRDRQTAVESKSEWKLEAMPNNVTALIAHIAIYF